MKRNQKIKKTALFSLIFCLLFAANVQATGTQKALQEDDGQVQTILEATQPKVVVDSYEVSDGEMATGQKFTLKVNVKNTNPYNDAYNLMVTLTSETDNVRIQDFAPNQVFVEKLAAGETTSVEFSMEVSEQFESDTMILDIYLDCVDENGIGYTITSIITPQIAKQCEMEINALSVAESAVVGSKSLVNVRYSNTGVVPIEHVTMHLEGDIMDSPKDVELERLEVEEQKYLDYYVNFLKEGKQNVTISFTYEDGDGTVYELDPEEFQVDVTAFSPVVTSVTSDSQQGIIGKIMSMQSQSLLLYGILICAVVLFLLLGSFMLIRSKKNKKGGR